MASMKIRNNDVMMMCFHYKFQIVCLLPDVLIFLLSNSYDVIFRSVKYLYEFLYHKKIKTLPHNEKQMIWTL